MTGDGGQPVLFTSRIRSARWDNLKRAHDIVFGEAIYMPQEPALLSAKIYRNDTDSSDVLLVSEWRSFEDLRLFALEHGERFNGLAGTQPDEGEDVVWRLVEPMGATLGDREGEAVTEEEQRVLSTTRVRPANWDNLKTAFDLIFREAIHAPGDRAIVSVRIYRNDADPADALFASEWRSFEALHAFALEHGEQINTLMGVRPDEGEEVAWRLADAMVAGAK